MVGLLHLQGRRALLGSEAVAGLGALAEVNSNFRRSPGLLEPHVFSINYFFFENLKKDRNLDRQKRLGWSLEMEVHFSRSINNHS